MRHVAIIVDSRATWTRARTICEAILARRDLELSLATVGPLAINDPSELDGIPVARNIMNIDTPTGYLGIDVGDMIADVSSFLVRRQPDIVLSITDRYESLATAVAASMSGILLAHTQGGERTGSLDEAMRHAITKLAQIHFPSNADAAQRIIRMGEDPAHVHNVGCPATDLLLRVDVANRPFGPSQPPYILVAYNPVVTEHDNLEQMRVIMQACSDTGLPLIIVGPNHDPGNVDIWQGIREYPQFTHYATLPHDIFIRYMARAAVMVGNSSAGIREACYFGTPVVDVGTRQQGRLRSPNVATYPNDNPSLLTLIEYQVKHGRFGKISLYGDGTAGIQIAEILATCDLPPIQKRMMY
jgi:UDP-hydrolysing UDP-N-acetyl-D-glucosamine 2-epimerase